MAKTELDAKAKGELDVFAKAIVKSQAEIDVAIKGIEQTKTKLKDQREDLGDMQHRHRQLIIEARDGLPLFKGNSKS